MSYSRAKNKHIKKILSKYLITDIIDIIIGYFSNSKEWEIEKTLNFYSIPEDIIYIILDYSKEKVKSKPEPELYIPLEFWFCGNPGLSLPFL